VSTEFSLGAGRKIGIISLVCMGFTSLGMTACASKPKAGEMSLVESKPVYAQAEPEKKGKIGSTMKKSAMDVGDGFGDALAAPLEDLNLRRDDIPAILIRASTKTYDLTGMERCEGIAAEVRRLDEVLGDDFDEPPPPESDMTEKSGRAATNYTLGAVRSAARDIIPMRGLVRKITGAEKHQKSIDRAEQAGIVRRAYLKGIGLNKNCAPPAAPSWFVPAVMPQMAEDVAPRGRRADVIEASDVVRTSPTARRSNK
jgi:hypothetical protein